MASTNCLTIDFYGQQLLGQKGLIYQPQAIIPPDGP
jgi:hypothetical protein